MYKQNIMKVPCSARDHNVLVGPSQVTMRAMLCWIFSNKAAWCPGLVTWHKLDVTVNLTRSLSQPYLIYLTQLTCVPYHLDGAHAMLVTFEYFDTLLEFIYPGPDTEVGAGGIEHFRGDNYLQDHASVPVKGLEHFHYILLPLCCSTILCLPSGTVHSGYSKT